MERDSGNEPVSGDYALHDTDAFAVLSTALRAVTSTSDPKALTRTLAGEFARIMPVQSMALIATTEQSGQVDAYHGPVHSPMLETALTALISRDPAPPDVEGNPATILMPIVIQGQALGAIGMYAGSGMAYTERDRALVEQVGLALGLALNARRLAVANQRRTCQLEAIERFAGRLNRLHCSTEIAEALTSEVGAITAHDTCRVYLAEGNDFRLASSAGYESDTPPELDDGEILVVTDDPTRPTIHELPDGAARLAVPLYHEGDCTGLLLLERHDSAFDQDDVQLVESLAAHTATAISDAIAHSELQRRVQELENLQRAVATVNANLDRKTTLDRIVTALAGVAGYRMIGLYMRDEDELVLQAQVGYRTVIDRLPMERGVMARCVRDGRSILLEDVRADPDYIAALTEIRSEVAVPVLRDGRAVGVLNVESGPERKLGQWDLALVELFSQQVSVALANVSRFERAVERATMDWVSGLPNHGALMERLAEAVREADEGRAPLSLLFIDLDHFKSINDLYGHRFGDSVLAAMGRLLSRWTPEQAWPARYGGEEFVVLLPDTDEPGALRIAATIQSALAEQELATPTGSLLHLTVSIGTATRQPDQHSISTPEDLLESADRAMYTAKYGGRNRIVPWTRDLDEPQALAS